jgi:hypothetical protein
MIIKPLAGVFAEYQPEIGKVYDAKYIPRESKGIRGGNSEFCVIEVKDKWIILRRDEFAVVG